MPHRKSFSFRRALLLFLLIFGSRWRRCAAQVDAGEAREAPDGHGGDGGAFFPLQSCHRLLGGDSGEFFSPDYLCSNPPLWCNWTIRADPGKRIQLHLEDFTPDDVCHLKQDQVHVDEPAGRGVHKVLQKCWREAKYTTTSSALNVVLLIAGWPDPPYRGFYGRYQAFGPPVVYNPADGFVVSAEKSEPPAEPIGEVGPVTDGEQTPLEPPSAENSDEMYEYYDQPPAVTYELPYDGAADPQEGENLHPASENSNRVNPFVAEPTVPASTHGTSRSERDVVPTASSSRSDSAVSPPQHRDGPDQERAPAAVRRDAEDASTRPDRNRSEEDEPAASSEQAADGESGAEVSEASQPRPSAAEGPEPGETGHVHPHPNVVEPLSDRRGGLRNHSEPPSHLPGDHLFEVAVEVNFSPDVEDSWDDLARSLLLSVKALIAERLEALHAPLSVSPKRIKRLNAGVLYILWLQTGREPGGQQVHRAVHAAVQGLIATGVGLSGIHRRAAIVSVSTADVNECGTQLVLCDVNADCVNQFGSYSCRCRPGLRDESRLGSGGTVCVDAKAAGCSSGLSAETKGVYVLFFLLSSLILLLLAAAGLLYHRHRRGMFPVRCHSSGGGGGSVSSPDPNNNRHRHDGYSSPADSDLPPPPPPARGPREGWTPVKERCPAVDLPLLRFSPLRPPDGYVEPREGGKL